MCVKADLGCGRACRQMPWPCSWRAFCFRRNQFGHTPCASRCVRSLWQERVWQVCGLPCPLLWATGVSKVQDGVVVGSWWSAPGADAGELLVKDMGPLSRPQRLCCWAGWGKGGWGGGFAGRGSPRTC
jgi:hypothetical protein